MAFRGLRLIQPVLRMLDQEGLMLIWQTPFSKALADSVEEAAFCSLPVILQLRDFPSDRDLRQQRREPFPFRGDVEDDPDGMYPPLGWTLVWKGTYSNMFGYFISNQVHHWGYIM